MSPETVGCVVLLALLALLCLRVPVAAAMLLAASAGHIWLNGSDTLLNIFKTGPYYLFSGYTLSVVPLFLLMGSLAARSGISRTLFDSANAFFGRRRGGLSMAAIGACTLFGSVSGSSLATAATMGRIAYPEMRRLAYPDSLATGSLAAGGTLGILIPPSIVIVIYAFLAEQSVVRMFIAASVPAVLAVAGYLVAASLAARLHPQLDRPVAQQNPDRRSLLHRTLDVLPTLGLFAAVIGGIYAGVFTPTEGASVGVAGAGLIALAMGMRLDGLLASVRDAASVTAMVYLILLGADLFSSFLALSGLGHALAGLAGSANTSPYVTLALILFVYVVLGCFMESLSMVVMTMPIFLPVVLSLDFGMTPEHTSIWFGILALTVVEMGLITPPVGLNLLVIGRLAPGVRTGDLYRGVVPYIAWDVFRLAVLVAFPFLVVGWFE